jgi:hypothetical protein
VDFEVLKARFFEALDCESAIVTLVERSTRYVMPGHLPGGHTAEEVRDVLVPLIQTLPEHLRGSLTWDQGCEMAALLVHHRVAAEFGGVHADERCRLVQAIPCRGRCLVNREATGEWLTAPRWISLRWRRPRPV